MKISLNWIRELVDLPESAAEVGAELTKLGLPVDALDERTLDLTNFVVGEVVAAERHPNADKLTLCQVNVGAETLQIICGAPNAAVGVRAAVALGGAVLPDGTKIKRAKLRGVESNGMMCSERELGLSTEHKGIIDFGPQGPAPGTPLREVMGGGDALYELDIPSNRGDCFSHLGVARELAARYERPLRRPASAPTEASEAAAGVIRVEVADAEDCPRYMARVIRGVTVGPSPEWLRQKLAAIGQRSINNVVDVTNLILWERGQPLHAFDADRIGGGRIVVRRAHAGEVLTTLDGQARTLTAEVLVIADAERALALAGLMGGAESEVTDGTTTVLLEGAAFNAFRVLKGTQVARLLTDAALRFIRGVDPVGVADALDRGARLIAEVSGGRVLAGAVDVAAPGATAIRQVTYRAGAAERLLGEPIPDPVAMSLLARLGFTSTAGTGGFTVVIPGHRSDVREECDLVEEVARLYGYDRIGERSHNAGGLAALAAPTERALEAVRRGWQARGFSEMLTRALIDPADQEKSGVAGPYVEIPDPPSREEASLRASLLPGALRAISHNIRHGRPALRLFEAGTVFRPAAAGPLADEPIEILAVATAGQFGPDLTRLDPVMDYARFKGLVEAWLETLRVDTPETRCYDETDFEPRTSAIIEARDREGRSRLIGRLGQLAEERCRLWDIDRPVFVARFDFTALLECIPAVAVYREASRFPASTRDLAFLLEDRVAEADVVALIRATGGPLLKRATLFDRYTGKPLPEGHVSLGYALTWLAEDRTLADEEVRKLEARVVERLRDEFGAVLRDGA